MYNVVVFCYIMNKSHWLSLFKSKHGTKIRKAKTQRYESAHEGQQLTVQLNDILPVLSKTKRNCST